LIFSYILKATLEDEGLIYFLNEPPCVEWW